MSIFTFSVRKILMTEFSIQRKIRQLLAVTWLKLQEIL